MIKGEIARFVQFLFFVTVFKKPFAAEASESVYMRERVKKNEVDDIKKNQHGLNSV